MRSTKLTAATLAAAASLTLSCAAAASAAGRLGPRIHPNLTPAHGCHNKLELLSRVIHEGTPATALGKLSCAVKTEEENQPVKLYERAVGAATFTEVGSGTTDENGEYKVESTAITSNSALYTLAGDIRSPLRPLRVIAEVKLEGPTEGVLFTAPFGRRHSIPAVFKGTVTPSEALSHHERGAVVVLQRQNALTGNGWLDIGQARVSSTGAFTIPHDFVVPGPANIRVVVLASRFNVTSPSNILNYEISQAENPALTITSTHDPISYGQSTTIEGVLAGAKEGTPVVLLSRTAHTPDKFTQVAKTTTEAGGKYVFPSQSPTTGTFYKVNGGGQVSAQLYEAVKYLLTVTSVTPGTTVNQGETLTISGTVEPGVAKHLLYLEREDANGTGFHVVAIGEETTETAPGSKVFDYTISYVAETPGTAKYLVRIPGDPQNGTTASEPFAIQVLPSPASALKPLTPPTLPSNGQV
ncbi:MAG TPA: hypothetical protein VGY13_11545 [Solirubrobacteraceae bacterium]|jgi:biotin carboxyl carrier protein|nr:hypothetical protein [Solirubrobacteraceae bacterium]